MDKAPSLAGDGCACSGLSSEYAYTVPVGNGNYINIQGNDPELIKAADWVLRDFFLGYQDFLADKKIDNPKAENEANQKLFPFKGTNLVYDRPTLMTCAKSPLSKKLPSKWSDEWEMVKVENPSLYHQIVSKSKNSPTKIIPSHNPSDRSRILWVDCEMTGLDTTVDTLLEVAVIVTDKDMNIVMKGPNIVIHQPEKVLSSMNKWCIKHHRKSGLSEMVRNSKISLEEAENQLVSFVKEWTPEKKCPLAGNSVGQDAKFLEKYMPKLMNHLHYRIIDVSTIKELSRRWYPEEFAMIPKKKLMHRALYDIEESIEEMRYYKKYIFK